MTAMKKFAKPEYLVSPSGARRSVVLPIAEYEQLLEDYEDLKVVAERKAQVKLPAVDFLNKLKKNGRI